MLEHPSDCRLPSLLRPRRDGPGPELAERLEATARTVRRDAERLRTLGCPVYTTPGTADGHRLGAGAALPPLLLDDEEAIAVALCLCAGAGAGAGGSVEGVEETSTACRPDGSGYSRPVASPRPGAVAQEAPGVDFWVREPQNWPNGFGPSPGR